MRMNQMSLVGDHQGQPSLLNRLGGIRRYEKAQRNLHKSRKIDTLLCPFSGAARSGRETALFINPSVNYAVTEKLGLRLGTTLEYRKNIGWDSGRRNYMPLEAGVTYDISPKLNIYTYVLTSTPLDDGIRRAQLKTNNPPSWSKTTSINIWLSGTLF